MYLSIETASDQNGDKVYRLAAESFRSLLI